MDQPWAEEKNWVVDKKRVMWNLIKKVRRALAMYQIGLIFDAIQFLLQF